MGGMVESKAAVDFANREWSTASDNTNTRMMKDSVVSLSEHARIDPMGKINRLLCGSNPSAAEKRRYKRNCECVKLGKDCHIILCGCKGAVRSGSRRKAFRLAKVQD